MSPRGGRRPGSGRPTVPTGRAAVSISMPPELAATLREHAAELGVTVSAVVVAVLLDYLAGEPGAPEAR